MTGQGFEPKFLGDEDSCSEPRCQDTCREDLVMGKGVECRPCGSHGGCPFEVESACCSIFTGWVWVSERGGLHRTVCFLEERSTCVAGMTFPPLQAWRGTSKRMRAGHPPTFGFGNPRSDFSVASNQLRQSLINFFLSHGVLKECSSYVELSLKPWRRGAAWLAGTGLESRPLAALSPFSLWRPLESFLRLL